jgi:hypothetical protein
MQTTRNLSTQLAAGTKIGAGTQGIRNRNSYQGFNRGAWYQFVINKPTLNPEHPPHAQQAFKQFIDSLRETRCNRSAIRGARI